ncbi:MAG: nucleotidyl transferase AbiEii/AbiGii toxin family protein [Sulfurimonas sp.]|nr:nucleotidyl transferase AbiEii/AbiGii toxin family protein [Sulfurimonas sp.]MDD3059369.1 nucleotidyl transferase AbiEii/AbiGii toxin family protein [Sulfurimonas sp.]MDD5202270.1 nucleotidyl transferase AbiEii/AbiGii toxin family protein [Sulfurimonas sp.]
MANTHPHITAMLQKYDLSKDDPYEALREILQEIVLYALSDAGFFNHAVFYGGTALRILYGLPRFSEDLDFSLLKPDPSFDLGKYEKAVLETLKTYGFEAQIETKIKDHSTVQSAFIKGNTIKHLLAINAPEDIVKSFNAGKLLKIKFEVDTEPPINFEEEQKLHLTPAPFMVRSMKPSSLFAGKLHAVLCRGWQNRPKGRDWYDMVWYVQNKYEVNLTHLATRLIQSCKALQDTEVELPEEMKLYTAELIVSLLQKRVDTLDITLAKQDVHRFIYDEKQLDIWSKDFFYAIIKMIKFK